MTCLDRLRSSGGVFFLTEDVLLIRSGKAINE